MSAHLGCTEQTLFSQGNRIPQNKPRKCKQDKSSNPNCLYWLIEQKQRKTLFGIKQPHIPNKPPRPFTSEVLFSFSGNYDPHLATQDIPLPNNVAEDLSPKLPSQIGSVASTQLGLKYGNCISHYRGVRGELLKVRRGYTSGVICCGDLCLHSRKQHHDEGTAKRSKEHSRDDK